MLENSDERPEPERDPKYTISERVQCHGLFGKVEDIKWIFHNRGDVWVWGYKIAWEDKEPGLSIVYLPEGYLQKES
ncbi:MAG: hypothetical protein WC819_01325 [Parcubacteria group bacterium]|jgi:hypothetical protein